MATDDERDEHVGGNAGDGEHTEGASPNEGPIPYQGLPDHTGWFGGCFSEAVLFLFGFIALPLVDVLVLMFLIAGRAPRSLAILVCVLLYAGGVWALARFFPKPAAIGALLGAVIPLIAFGACLNL